MCVRTERLVGVIARGVSCFSTASQHRSPPFFPPGRYVRPPADGHLRSFLRPPGGRAGRDAGPGLDLR